MIIYLAGFMGAGKSTIGPILANTLGWDFYDLDKVIEEKENKKIREIFDEKGESYFREIEKNNLIELSKQKKTIVSLGGGTMVSDKNIEILKQHGITFYLKTSIDSMYKRLLHKRDRPQLKINEKEEFSKEEFVQRLNELFNNRKDFYEQADYIINTDNTSVGITVDKIAKIVKQEMLRTGLHENY